MPSNSLNCYVEVCTRRSHEASSSTPTSPGAVPPLSKTLSTMEFHNLSPFHLASDVSRITLISDESSHLSGESAGVEQPPTTAAEILDTIEKRLCILPGGTDKKGRLIICVPPQGKVSHFLQELV